MSTHRHSTGAHPLGRKVIGLRLSRAQSKGSVDTTPSELSLRDMRFTEFRFGCRMDAGSQPGQCATANSQYSMPHLALLQQRSGHMGTTPAHKLGFVDATPEAGASDLLGGSASAYASPTARVSGSCALGRTEHACNSQAVRSVDKGGLMDTTPQRLAYNVVATVTCLFMARMDWSVVTTPDNAARAPEGGVSFCGPVTRALDPQISTRPCTAHLDQGPWLPLYTLLSTTQSLLTCKFAASPVEKHGTHLTHLAWRTQILWLHTVLGLLPCL